MRVNPVFDIAIPDTFTEGYNLLKRTVSVGMLARAASIFRVERIYIYREKARDSREDISRQVVKILEYLNTPQYLRKFFFKLDPDLKFVGVLPPLRTPHHKLKIPLNEVEIGEIREGVVLRSRGRYSIVHVGLDRDVIVKGELRPGKRVIVRILGGDKFFRGEVVGRGNLKEYWGYEVIVTNGGLDRLLKNYKGLRILTSRKGDRIDERFGEIVAALKSVDRVLVVFGSARKGVFEILGSKIEKNLYEYILNIAPTQGTQTIRTEEAVLISLGIFNTARLLGEARPFKL